MSEADFYNSVDPEITGEGADWAYSTCTGTKKALLIGINYVGTESELSGCVNDVLNLRKFITERWGYENENIVTVTDDPKVSSIAPTRKNIIAQLQELVKDAKQNDALFLCYSGHGTQVRDKDGNEIDKMDEAICPVDYNRAGFIIDDELNELIVKPLPLGCRLTVVFDCCNSGSALDLLYMYGPTGHILDGASPDDPKKSPADILYLSGCRDDQTSADTVEEGRATGALSHAFVDALTQRPEQSYLEMLSNTRKILKKKRYTQIPQLSSSHPIDTSLQFII
ncbi:peptidase C14 [Ephemerocybe angulata]|uniref:Peptidase C14 n=1 Tax=Ephemerocybe angulata TaxID=980116 RepID=A0A8H6M7T9_9AGAR|nr:peptidase C14 [Tulosesus angulatus]